MNARPYTSNMLQARRLILHQTDMRAPRPGGIDTCIQDLVRTDPAYFAVGGVEYAPSARGPRRWFLFHDLTPVLTVAVMQTGKRCRIPETVSFAAGLIRSRRRLGGSRSVQTHRVELGVLVALLFPTKRRYLFIHGDARPGLSGHSDSRWRHIPWAYLVIEHLACRLSHEVVVFSRAGSARLERSHGKKVRYSPTWFDGDTFYPSIGAVCKRLLWVGRLTGVKDPSLACDVLRKLRDVDSEWRLTVVGDGPLMTSVRADAERDGLAHAIDFMGSLDRTAVADCMRGHSVLLSTSRFEGVSRVLLESVACGTPVVCTSEADPAATVVDQLTGFRVRGRDPRELAEAVVRAARLQRSACASAGQLYRSDRVLGALLETGR